MTSVPGEPAVEIACIALVGRWSGYDVAGRECSRIARVSLDSLARGSQPLCHQHRQGVEGELQRLHLGRGRIVVPSMDELSEWPGAWQRCVAVVAVGDDPESDWGSCEHLACWMETALTRSPLAVPLCVGHAMALTYAFRRAWNLSFLDVESASERSHPGWGWEIAEAYDRAPPAWEPY